MQTLILNHYPPVIKQIEEIKQIALAEDIEFSKLNVSIDRVIRNMFILTADFRRTKSNHFVSGKPTKNESIGVTYHAIGLSAGGTVCY